MKHGMQLLRFQAVQDPDYPHDEECGGAYVNCWMRNRTEEEACLDASNQIKALGWMIVNLDEQFPITLDDYDPDDESIKYHRQAETDGEVFVFHVWPPGAYD